MEGSEERLSGLDGLTQNAMSSVSSMLGGLDALSIDDPDGVLLRALEEKIYTIRLRGRLIEGLAKIARPDEVMALLSGLAGNSDLIRDDAGLVRYIARAIKDAGGASREHSGQALKALANLRHTFQQIFPDRFPSILRDIERAERQVRRSPDTSRGRDCPHLGRGARRPSECRSHLASASRGRQSAVAVLGLDGRRGLSCGARQHEWPDRRTPARGGDPGDSALPLASALAVPRDCRSHARPRRSSLRARRATACADFRDKRRPGARGPRCPAPAGSPAVAAGAGAGLPIRSRAAAGDRVPFRPCRQATGRRTRRIVVRMWSVWRCPGHGPICGVEALDARHGRGPHGVAAVCPIGSPRRRATARWATSWRRRLPSALMSMATRRCILRARPGGRRAGCISSWRGAPNSSRGLQSAAGDRLISTRFGWRRRLSWRLMPADNLAPPRIMMKPKARIWSICT